MPRFIRQACLLVVVGVLMSVLPSARPALAATFTVTTTGNEADVTNGDGSCATSLSTCTLRAAIQEANALAGPDTINFNIPTSDAGYNSTLGVWTISPSIAGGVIPSLTDLAGGTTIDATTQPGGRAAGPKIEISGVLFGSGAPPAFTIISASNTIRGFVINRFDAGSSGVLGIGIYINGDTADSNTISGNWIGLHADGVNAAPNTNSGIIIRSGDNNTVRGNVIAGNGGSVLVNVQNILVGVGITSAVNVADNNVIAGNLIGTNSAGTALPIGAPNTVEGVFIGSQTSNTTVGGTTIADRNVIVGASAITGSFPRSAVRVQYEPSTNNTIRGNYLGVDAAGTTALANIYGVTVRDHTSSLQITDNLISGNTRSGVYVHSLLAAVSNVTLQDNRIGISSAGGALGNGLSGVEITRDPASNHLISNITIRGNTISANGAHGITVAESGDSGSLYTGIAIAGNAIGTAPGGASTTTALLNAQSGIVFNAGSGNTIGGASGTDRNIIAAGLNQAAVRLTSANVTGFTVANNYIGIASDGSTALISAAGSRAAFGVLIQSGSTGHTIGPNNVVGGNDSGIQINGSSGNTVSGNVIGGAATGLNGPGNTQFGVWLLNAPNNTIGGSLPADGNIIRNNSIHGIFADGTSSNLTIGRNTVRFNNQVGIQLNSSGSAGAAILNNTVSDNNQDGIRVIGATGVRISQTTTAANVGAGIALQSGGNGGLAAPTLNATLTSGPGGVPQLSGTASGCGGSGCVVEVFTNADRDDGEGPIYLASGTANPLTGAFTIDVSGCARYLTATARDPITNNTSAFTTPMADTTTGCSQATPLLSEGTPATTGAAPRSVSASSTVTYQHTLTNNGGQSGTFTLSSSSSPQGWASSVSPTTVTLGPLATATVTVTITVPASPAGGTVEQTSVTATSGALSDTRIDYSRVPQAFGVNIEPPRNQLFIGSASPVDVDFTHTITNTGNGVDTFTLSATNGTIAGSPTFSFPDGNQCVSLAAGAGCTRRVRVTLPASSTGGTITATATGGGGATDSVVDTAFTTSVIPSLTSVAQQDAFPSASVQFVHTLENVGNQAGTFTPTLIEPSPLDGWVYSFTPNTSFSLNAGETRTITVTATVPGIATTGAISGTIKTATLQVTASSGAIATANDATRVLQQPQFSFSAAGTTPVSAAPLATVVFTHTLQNTSNGDDRYTIVITPTAGLENVSVSPASPVSVLRGGSAQVVVQARVRAGTIVGSESLAVTAQSVGLPRPAPQTQTDTVNVVGATVPSLSVAPASRSTPPGAVVRFTYTLTNTGNQDGTFAAPTFTLPTAQAGWSAVVVAPAPACISGGNLAAGASCSIDVDVTAPAGAFAGSHQVRASVASVTTPTAPVATASSTVVVTAAPALSFTASQSATTNPTAPISYTHTLTNTGNITDTFSFSLQAPAGWTAPAPATLTGVPPGGVRSVVVTITPPAGLLAGSTGVVTVTATAATAPNPTAAVVDTTTIASVNQASLTPALQTNGGAAGLPTFFFPTLRNTGSTALAFDLSVTTAGWTSIVTPTTTPVLQPGATLPLTMSVQVPAGTGVGVDNLSTLEVRGSGNATLLASGQYTTTTALIGSLLDPVSNARTALPGATVVYTHTLRNTTGQSDTFTLRTIATNGWQVTVAPASVFLAAGASREIEVRVTVPPARPAGEQDYSYVEVQSLADPSLSALGTEVTTVQRFAAAQLSPSQSRTVTPGQVLEFQHTLLNQGNALDTFQISVSNQLGWSQVVAVPAGAQVALLPGATFPVEVRVIVPANVSPGTANIITVRAISAFDGTDGRAVHSAVYPIIAGPPPPPPTYFVNLPQVIKP